MRTVSVQDKNTDSLFFILNLWVNGGINKIIANLISCSRTSGSFNYSKIWETMYDAQQ